MEKYFTRKSDDDELEKYCQSVDYYDFPNHLEAVGISYVRHFRTIAEIQEDINNLKKLPLSQEKYDAELKLLQLELESRKQVHSKKSSFPNDKVKSDNMKSVRRSQKQLMLYLYANFDVPFCFMITLTYAEKVYDLRIAREHFKVFIRKLRRKYQNIMWIAYYDFHQDDSIHIHLVIRNIRGFTSEEITNMWGHGRAFISEFEQERIPYFCKNTKLDKYPAGSKLYTKSKNCKKPIKRKMSVENFEKLTKDMECTYSSAKTLYIQEGKNIPPRIVNRFIYKNYKKKGKANNK